MSGDAKSLQINAGDIRLSINDDPNRIITINPQDVIFIEKLYSLENKLRVEMDGYQRRAAVLESDDTLDDNGRPKNIPERIALMVEVGERFRAEIDDLFGAGTSAVVFGSRVVPNQVVQFLEQVQEYIRPARAEKIAQYTTAASAKRNRRRAK